MAELEREQLLMAVISGRGPAYLRGLNLSKLNLSNVGWLAEADLREANLSEAMLERTNLTDANFQGANLRKTNFRRAILVGADLRNANLNVADLQMADLRNAKLQGASLVGANLERAKLQGANTQGANMEGANLVGAIFEEEPQAGILPDSDGFSGTVKDIQLADLIQLVCLSRANFFIQVKSSEGSGVVHVRSGQLSHAKCGDLQGEEAFFKMLRWKDGHFETLPLKDDQTINTIDKPWEYLLIEGMRVRDEVELARRKDLQLIDKVKEELPIAAYPTKALMEFLRKQGKDITINRALTVTDAFDSGDAGGIFCSVSYENEMFIVPLIQLIVRSDHPLRNEILAYQKEALQKMR